MSYIKRIKRGEIRLCDLGEGYGSIQGGVRPCLVIQNNTGNKYSPVVIVVPITSRTTTKANLPTHYFLPKHTGLKEDSLLLLEQIMTINKKQVGRKVTKLNCKMMHKVENKLDISLGVSRVQKRNLYLRQK